MSPIHKGAVLGRKIAQVRRLAKKVKKNLISRGISIVTLSIVYDRIVDYPSTVERLTNSDAENGSADDFVYDSLVELIEQLLRTAISNGQQK